jgi:hypothetical protein
MTDPITTCASKKRYTRNQAQKAKRRRTKQTGVYHEYYECPICYWWHLKSYGFVGQPSINKPIREDYLK